MEISIKRHNPAIAIMAINVMLFVAMRIFDILGGNTGNLLDNVAVTASGGIHYLWTPLTYHLIHTDLLHLLFNFALLASVCRWLPVSRNIDPRHFYITYFTGVVAGAIAFVLYASDEATLIGASCGVIAIAIRNIILTTRHKAVSDRISTAVIATIIFILHIALLIPDKTNIAIVHSAGAAAGIIAAIPMISSLRNANRRNDVEESERRRINDKIRNSGYSSLTPSERATFENM